MDESKKEALRDENLVFNVKVTESVFADEAFRAARDSMIRISRQQHGWMWRENNSDFVVLAQKWVTSEPVEFVFSFVHHQSLLFWVLFLLLLFYLLTFL